MAGDQSGFQLGIDLEIQPIPHPPPRTPRVKPTIPSEQKQNQ
jgi:hypothetical protein